MTEWKRIAIVQKSGESDRATDLSERLAAAIREAGCEVALANGVAARAPEVDNETPPELEAVVRGSDLVVVLGGDGTVLAVARAIGERPSAIFAVNLGRLGFLADVNPDEAVEGLAAVLAGDYVERERARLEVSVDGAARAGSRAIVLNDAVITKGPALARMIEIDASIDGRRVATYHSDGLIVSTPTGSTAYSLSAGGPLVDVAADVTVLNPICPHTLTMRPLVVPRSARIDVQLRSADEAILTLDGQVGVALDTGDVVRVRGTAPSARFVSHADHNSFDTWRTKLGWATR